MELLPHHKKEEKLQQELYKAIINNEFILHYQPQFHIASSTYLGIEALIRWQHPTRGLLLPNDFISVAEQDDELIIAIGNWVLKSACIQFKRWQDKGLSPVRIAVNVSGSQLRNREFVDFIFTTLDENQLKPNCLELELNENIIIHDDDIEMIQMIEQLSEAGVLIALDDIGTGNSNIQYLTKIPVDRIKIDKTYIQNIQHNNHDMERVKALIMLAAGLHLEIVAEGVETFIQLQTLLSHECKEIQGYYFSEPLPAKQLEMFLGKHQGR